MFFAFEGGDGGGKSTQIVLMADRLRDAGVAVTTTREPGATPLGAQLRQLLLFQDEAMAPKAEALLFAADRAQHIEQVIRPALDRGDVVLTDRYIDSSLAYQGAGSRLAADRASAQALLDVSLWAAGGLLPTLTFVLDVDPELGLTRAGRRAAADTMELRDLAFHRRLRHRFLDLATADPGRYVVIDATAHRDRIAEMIFTHAETALALSTADRPQVA